MTRKNQSAQRPVNMAKVFQLWPVKVDYYPVEAMLHSKFPQSINLAFNG